MYRIQFPRSLAGFARASVAFIMVALALLGSVHSAAAAGSTVTATAIGSGIQFHGRAITSITWELSVSTSSIITSGGTPSFPSTAKVTFFRSTAAQATFDPFAGGLSPNTTYNYIMRANTTYHTGSVKTKQRSMNVTFNQITITNDSDSTGAGELMYHFFAASYHPELDFRKDVSSPTTFTANKTIPNILNGQPKVVLAVEVQDDDCTFSTCFRPADFTNGSDGDNDWATAVSTIDSISDQSNSITKTVNLSVNGAVGFKVSALVQVTYF
jgi:hypothetical protein